MPNYVILINWTDQGVKNVKDTIKRAKAFETAIEKVGGKSNGIYYTLGKHDLVAIAEAPTDEAIASVMFSTGSLAFSTSEVASRIEKLP